MPKEPELSLATVWPDQLKTVEACFYGGGEADRKSKKARCENIELFCGH
jgi:hypothetical protein